MCAWMLGGDAVTLSRGGGRVVQIFPGTAASDSLIHVRVIMCVNSLLGVTDVGCPGLTSPCQLEQREVVP